MQITFEVPVVVKAKPGRAVNERTVFGFVPVTLDVPVIDDAERLVVLRYDADQGSGFTSHEEFRGYMGRLYHDIRAKPADTVSLRINRHMFPDGLFDAQWEIVDAQTKRLFSEVGKDYLSLASAKMHPESYGDFHKHRRSEVDLEPISGMNLKGEFERDLRSQVDTFVRHVSGLVIMDGRFHFPEAEPLIRVTTGWLGDVGAEAVRERDRQVPGLLAGHGRNMDTLGYFRFDDLDRLRDEMAALAAGHRTETSIRNIEVFDDRYFEADPDVLTLAELGSVFRQYFASPLIEENESYEQATTRAVDELRRMPIDQIALYQKLCDGIDAVACGGDPSELEEAVMTIMESGPGSRERHYFVFGGNVERYATRIVERWNDRGVDIGISGPAGHSPG